MHHRRVPARPFSPRPRARLSALSLAIGGLLAVGPGLAVEYTKYNWTWNSPGYVDVASTCGRAQGVPGAPACSLPGDWYNDQPPPGTAGPADSPILSYGPYENSAFPLRNSYYDWVNSPSNGPGYAFRIDSVGITATGPVGTSSPTTNQVGIAAGQGISGAWEFSNIGAGIAQIQNARVEIKSGVASDKATLASWGLADNQLVDGKTGPWVTGLTAQTPVQTPIDKTFVSTLTPDSRAINNVDGTVRIQFFQQGGSTESPSAVLGDLSLQLNIQTANLKASSDSVVGRVGGGGTTASGKATAVVTNNPIIDPANPNSNLGFRATGVYAPAATNDTAGVFQRKDPVPPNPPVLLPNGSLTTDYLLAIPAFAAYGTEYTADVAVNRGDAPTDSTLAVTLKATGVGPRAQVSGFAAGGEGQIYLGGLPPVIDGLDTELTGKSGGQFYRNLVFDNIFGTDAGSLTDLTLGLNYMGAGVTLFEIVGGNEQPINDPDAIARISVSGAPREFRVYLDPSQAGPCNLVAAKADYCGGLLLTTDVQRALGVTTLAEQSTIFKFDLYANNTAAPLPGTPALVGLGLAALGMRRRRR